MSRRAAGVSFLAIAAFLFSIKYVTAAIYGSSMNGWSPDLFRVLLSSVGNIPSMLALLSFMMGLIYLGVAEWMEARHRTKDHKKKEPH